MCAPVQRSARAYFGYLLHSCSTVLVQCVALVLQGPRFDPELGLLSARRFCVYSLGVSSHLPKNMPVGQLAKISYPEICVNVCMHTAL